MPTEKCNFRCSYCYETFLKGRMSEAVVESIVRYLHKTVPRVPNLFLAWFGGEPLLHPPIIHRISSVYRDLQKRHGHNGSISITTNGYRLNDEVLDRLGSIDVNVYQVSLDGPKAVHDSQRLTSTGLGTYDTILENIERVLRKTRSDILLRMNIDSTRPEVATLMQAWLRDEVFPRFADFGSRVKYHVVSIWDASTKSIEGICLKEVHRFQTWMEVKRSLLAQEKTTPSEYLASLVSKPGKMACYAGKPNSVVIGADGRLYKCTVAFDLPENQIGFIRPDGELEIDPEREKQWTGQNFLTDPVCGSCAFSKSCQGISCGLTRIQTGQRPCPTEKRFHQLILEESE